MLRRGFGFWDPKEGEGIREDGVLNKNNAQNRISYFNCFLLITQLIHLNKQTRHHVISPSPIIHCNVVQSPEWDNNQSVEETAKSPLPQGASLDIYNAVIPAPFPQWSARQHPSRQMLTWPPTASFPSPARPAVYSWLGPGFGNPPAAPWQPVWPQTVSARLSVYKRFARSHS